LLACSLFFLSSFITYFLNISSYSYFCNIGAGHGEMDELEINHATDMERLKRQLSAQSVVKGSKEPTEDSVIDVSQLRVCFILENLDYSI
jgi:hypothetical protein